MIHNSIGLILDIWGVKTFNMFISQSFENSTINNEKVWFDVEGESKCYHKVNANFDDQTISVRVSDIFEK